MFLDQFRQMIPQNCARGREPETLACFTAQTLASFQHFTEEWFDEFKKLATRGRQHERAPLKKFKAKMIFELQDLTTHCRLLNAIRHFTHGAANAAIFGYVIEKLKVMNVHKIDIVTLPTGAGHVGQSEVDGQNVCSAREQNRQHKASNPAG